MKQTIPMAQNDRLTSTIGRYEAATNKALLALAAQAWPDGERAAYWRIIHDLVARGQGSQVVLLGLVDRGGWCGAQIGQVLPGRVALVWPPQFTNMRGGRLPEHEAAAVDFFARLHRELAEAGAELAQALTSADDELTGTLFELGEFTRVADLCYLAAEASEFPSRAAALPFEMQPFTAGDEERLCRLIDRTYVGTLDCPQLDGQRSTADVIAGYRAVGEFKPTLWHFARLGSEDVGCILVNLHPDANHAELVYLGLVPAYRGRGWGLFLTRQAQWLARQAGAERLVLAVDAANRPALGMYEEAAFAPFDRRAVWIKRL
jgi:ribosomal protein S18 acetylase RimI-like enzyme